MSPTAKADVRARRPERQDTTKNPARSPDDATFNGLSVAQYQDRPVLTGSLGNHCILDNLRHPTVVFRRQTNSPRLHGCKSKPTFRVRNRFKGELKVIDGNAGHLSPLNGLPLAVDDLTDELVCRQHDLERRMTRQSP